MTYDKCVICGCDTDVPEDTPIENRERYVDGSGQLCSDCYFNLYLKPSREEKQILTDGEMPTLLDILRKL